MTTKTPKPTFEQWMAAVNRAVERTAGLSADDLPDCAYRDWYDLGTTPERAARKAIRNAGGEF